MTAHCFRKKCEEDDIVLDADRKKCYQMFVHKALESRNNTFVL